MKLQQFFLLLSIIVLLLQLSCDMSTEPDETSPAPIVAIYPSSDYMNFPDSIRAIYDGTKTPLILKSILLPYNCPVSFAIANVGPEGSILNYTIADDGALGGFLDYTNGEGSLNAGSTSTITVSVDPSFTDSSFGGLVGSTLVLNIYTPKASNYVKTFVSIDIRNFNDEVQQLCGIWSGIWSGISGGAEGATSPVSGTWILNLQSVDWANQTASGSLTWNGSDTYWNPGPHAYIVDRTLIFNNFNAELNGNSPCDAVWLHIAGNKAPYSEELGVVVDPYGPDFHLDFSPGFGSITAGTQSCWSTLWSDPSGANIGYSGGLLYGSKSQ
ncbi:hypothetical protein KJ762_02910 [bacterium]|nr:hypothetical protein [bacterium]MBU1065030.1 hypothetical protein [bacterium]MBU1633442.1 hypothetical protein [bacterium]MBU1874748.1 hypothetical protein [bacterium]